MADAKTCPVCGKKISGFLSTEPAGQKSIETLKQIGIDIDGLCLYCAQAKLEQEQQQRRDAYAPVADRIEELERIVPGMVIAQTTPHFESQQADVIGIVSGHSVIGTGPISSLASAFTDFFGKDSIAYQEKIRDAESKSMLMAKMQALDMGASLISGMSISVSEATSGHGMIMVNCVGTAIRTKEQSPLILEYLELRKLRRAFVDVQGLEVSVV